jgi:glycerol kinase
MLAGLGCGLFDSLDQASAMRGAVESFTPSMGTEAREARLGGWRDALETVLRT